ncbi:hypothetical protein GCM10028824_42330 [Hymenobacter segetis]
MFASLVSKEVSIEVSSYPRRNSNQSELFELLAGVKKGAPFCNPIPYWLREATQLILMGQEVGSESFWLVAL